LSKKEALSFLKKNNKSIIRAWENYKIQVGHSNNSQLDGVFEQMFKAWVISNKKAITLLEKTSKKTKKPTKTVKSRTIKPKKTNLKSKKSSL
jgi:hypothetical protein